MRLLALPLRDAPTSPPPRRSVREMLARFFLSLSTPLSAGLQIGHRFGFDSGLMLDYACRNNAEGWGYIGRRVDRWFLNHFDWPALRERQHRLQETLRDLIRLHRPAENEVHIVDLGGAPARYLIELLGEIGHAGVSAAVLDPDPVSLGEGRRLAQTLGRDRIEFIRADPRVERISIPTLAARPLIVVASGWPDQVEADLEFRRLLGSAHDMLAAGGHLVLTVSCGDRRDAPWSGAPRDHDGSPRVTQNRDLSRIESWARAAGFDGVRSSLGPSGEHAVCVATRCRPQTPPDEPIPRGGTAAPCPCKASPRTCEADSTGIEPGPDH
ncbi:MAG: class I SAM-dependent methyltransferase family protein [Planctomycetes bacterium]|nr:class I SAM-dependent methyltransferase family protein [Planctomycetota bacterium]